MQYDFLAPQRIHFGWGRRREVGTLGRSLGRCAFVVLGSRTLETSSAWDEITASLARAEIEVVHAAYISREPTVADVDRTTAFLREHDADADNFILAVGGGSAIDLAKAAAALATNDPSAGVYDYLEGVGRGLKLVYPPLPALVMPTTGGTGSEATKNAVISCDDPPAKKSLRSEWLLPRIVLIDPELSLSVPPRTTAWTGMDAITQLIESYLSRRAQPIPQALALHGLELATPAIVEAVHNGQSRAARESMAHAALLSGMALANSGLGLAHGVAAALGSLCGTPHGLACAVMLPAAMRFNRPVCTAPMARLGEVLAGRRFVSIAAAADAAIAEVDRLCEAVQIPRRLRDLGVRAEQIPALVAGSRGNSMNGNPRDVSDAALRQLLEEML